MASRSAAGDGRPDGQHIAFAQGVREALIRLDVGAVDQHQVTIFGGRPKGSMIWLIGASGATSSSTMLLCRASGGRKSVSEAKSLKVIRIPGL